MTDPMRNCPRLTRRLTAGALRAVISLLLAACGGPPFSAGGGDLGSVGGNSGAGGFEPNGGESSSAGRASGGEQTGIGGTVGAGGAANGSLGGDISTGGSQAGIGSGASAGGERASGGSVTTGGFAPRGGQFAMGGGATTGGAKATGGDSATGGALATGGNLATGGAVATGGTQGTGGSAPMCQHDNDCTLCAYPTGPTGKDQCYCTSCASDPMNTKQCEENKASWTRYCSDVVMVCPLAGACIVPTSVVCVQGTCVESSIIGSL